MLEQPARNFGSPWETWEDELIRKMFWASGPTLIASAVQRGTGPVIDRAVEIGVLMKEDVNSLKSNGSQRIVDALAVAYLEAESFSRSKAVYYQHPSLVSWISQDIRQLISRLKNLAGDPEVVLDT